MWTPISVCIKYYITKKNTNIRKEYEEKPSVAQNLLISPKIHSFVLLGTCQNRSRANEFELYNHGGSVLQQTLGIPCIVPAPGTHP